MRSVQIYQYIRAKCRPFFLISISVRDIHMKGKIAEIQQPAQYRKGKKENASSEQCIFQT